MTAREAQRRRKAIAADRRAFEALRDAAIAEGDVSPDEIHCLNSIIADKAESEAKLAKVEAAVS